MFNPFQIHEITAVAERTLSEIGKHVLDVLTSAVPTKTLIPLKDDPIINLDPAGYWTISGRLSVAGTVVQYAYTVVVPTDDKKPATIRIARYDGNRFIADRITHFTPESIAESIEKLEAIRVNLYSRLHRANDGDLFTLCPACGNLCEIIPDDKVANGDYKVQCDTCLQDFYAVAVHAQENF